MRDLKDGFFIGVDVGGTKILAVLADGSGQVLQRVKRKTPKSDSNHITAQIEEAIEELLNKDKSKGVKGIGIGVPGVVDSSSGHVIFTPNIPFSDVPLGKVLGERFDLPIALGNDVNLGTFGEKWYGAAKEANSVVGIFPGTGIGGGIVLDGRLLEGARGAGGEIGHMIMQIDGPKCGCGNNGCMEALASRTAIERDLRTAIEGGHQSVITEIAKGDLSEIKSGTLKKALQRKDPLTTEVLEKASRVLGLGVASVINLIDPEVVVFGGGLIEACGDFMLPIILEVARESVMPGVKKEISIVRSRLEDDATALGAVALIQQRLLSSKNEETPESKEDASATYPRVDLVGFGEVKVGEETLSYDVVIRANGKVKKRKKKLSKQKYGTAHQVSAEEIEYVCKKTPDILIIGTGYSEGLKLAEDGERFLKKQGIRYALYPSEKAAQVFNEQRGRKALLLHTTC